MALSAHEFPPRAAVYQQTQRWVVAGVFDDMVHDLRTLLRWVQGRNDDPMAAVLDSRTLQSTPESGPRAGYDGHKLKQGSKIHLAVDTFGHLLALHVTPAWSAALVTAQSQLETLPPDALLATIQGAVLHRDRVQAAAFATLASRLASRQDLSTWERAGLDGAISQCRSLAGEQSIQRLLTDLDRERVALQNLRGEIVQTANEAEPGSIGDILDRFQFGTTLGARPAAPLDRESLFRRAGAGPAS